MDNTTEITWNSKEFLDFYSVLIHALKNGNTEARSEIKKLRSIEYRNTVEIVTQGYYTTEEGRRVYFPDMKEMQAGTTFYKYAFNVNDIPARKTQTVIEVRNTDCLKEGIRLIRKGLNPAVLNMASRQLPGGGVITGSGAQEEGLFRRTNLFRSLYQFTNLFINEYWFANFIPLAPASERYPMDRNFGGIYTPGALLFRENEKLGYKLMNKPEILSFISVAGINRPELKDSTHLADNMVEGTKNKIRTILRIGLRHGHDSLVLGALGCGAFRNPPAHIARLFHEVFEEPEFKNKYLHITFAILEDYNSHKKHNPEGNFKPFWQEFC